MLNFNNLYNDLNKNIYLSNDYYHKTIIEKYKEYLNELSCNINIYDRQFYFVTDQLDIEKEKRLKEGITFLESIGVKVNRITEDKKIFNLIYEAINKQ